MQGFVARPVVTQPLPTWEGRSQLPSNQAIPGPPRRVEGPASFGRADAPNGRAQVREEALATTPPVPAHLPLTPDDIAVLSIERIGALFPGLAAHTNTALHSTTLDTRSLRALLRLRVVTWGDLASLTVGELWATAKVGSGTLNRILQAASERSQQLGDRETLVDHFAQVDLHILSGADLSAPGYQDIQLGRAFPRLLTVRNEPIESSSLGNRAANTLFRDGRKTWGDLLDLRIGDLWAISGAGTTSVAQIVEAAARRDSELHEHPDALAALNVYRNEEPIEPRPPIVSARTRAISALRLAATGLNLDGRLTTAAYSDWRLHFGGPVPTTKEIVAIFGSWKRACSEADINLTSQRDCEIVELWAAGTSLDQLATQFGLSRQRIDQIAKRSGREREMTPRERERFDFDERWSTAIADQARRCSSLTEIAEALSLRRELVSELMQRHDLKPTGPRHAAVRREPTFSNERLLSSLRLAEEALQQRLTSDAYAQWSAADADRPSLPTIVNRFGSWSGALETAGLQHRVRSHISRTRYWTTRRIIDALRRWLDTAPDRLTVEQYEVFSVDRDDMPSTSLIRTRLGGGWPGAVQLGLWWKTVADSDELGGLRAALDLQDHSELPAGTRITSPQALPQSDSIETAAARIDRILRPSLDL